MVWEGMTGNCWTELVQQWGVRKVEDLRRCSCISQLILRQ